MHQKLTSVRYSDYVTEYALNFWSGSSRRFKRFKKSGRSKKSRRYERPGGPKGLGGPEGPGKSKGSGWPERSWKIGESESPLNHGLLKDCP